MKNKTDSINRINLLRKALKSAKPIHDTPVGLIHPYWARKPLNIVNTIIHFLSDDSDIVFDPFIGSGTVAFSALANNRNALASDINPLSIFITKNILELSSFTEEDLLIISDFYHSISEKFSKWYLLSDQEMIERVRYRIEGEYKNGNFQLKPIEAIVKNKRTTGWQGRKSLILTSLPKLQSGAKYQQNPINFQKIKLPENSRIAIPKGAVLAHFFDERNIRSINFILSEIYKSSESKKIKDALIFILSSSLPLLRLSDKKASSQWPYWRPKSDLTSRNPLFILNKRLEAFSQAVTWAREQITTSCHVDLKSLYTKKDSLSFSLIEVPAQKATSKGIKRNSIDLILTDPPYADHVPYLEYSELWNSLLLKTMGSAVYADEIVKTDAPNRRLDSDEYINRLNKAFETMCDTLKIGGFLAFFYQDKSLVHWSEIYKTLHEKKMHILDVIPLQKQRRSMKTVTSPGRTLDGDLLIIAVKSETKKIVSKTSDEYYQRTLKSLKGSFFEKYAKIIKAGFLDGTISGFAKLKGDIYSLLDKE